MWPGLSLGPVWVPPAVPCSVIGGRADLGPPLPPPRAVSFVQTRRGFRVERSNKKPRVPTSQGRNRGRPSPFPSSSSCAPALGGGPRRGATLLQGKAWNAWTGPPPRLDRAHVSTRVRTHIGTRTHRTPCAGLGISAVAGRGSTGRSLLRTCSLNSLPPRLSALQEFEVPVPCGRPPCLPRLPGASPRHSRSTKPRDPPFAGLLATLWVGFLTEDPLELRWEGGTLSSQNRPHHPRGRNISVAGFPLCTSDIGAPFSVMTSFWLGWDPRVPPVPSFQPLPASLWGWRATLESESLWG